jgi:hypothetical protein
MVACNFLVEPATKKIGPLFALQRLVNTSLKPGWPDVSVKKWPQKVAQHILCQLNCTAFTYIVMPVAKICWLHIRVISKNVLDWKISQMAEIRPIWSPCLKPTTLPGRVASQLATYLNCFVLNEHRSMATEGPVLPALDTALICGFYWINDICPWKSWKELAV